MLLLAACGKSPTPPPQIRWYDLHAGEAIARAQHKPAVVFFCAQWSMADKELDEKSFPNPEVAALMKDFVPVRIDATDTESLRVQEAFRRFGVLGLPTVLVLRSFDPDPKNEIVRLNEYHPAPELAAALRSAKRKLESNPP